ncbi:MAG: SusC/RagA family TonB-linked outer membrane protein [Flavobacteria bacterium RIFCSPLOWO2_12_FULL_35_11]|nr:MAG: SusC/RagA family TonB-linked outer membrane protein [Flavobacteria bacterium RIFCSPLOWO2_12_FULL_35_11]
MKLTTFLLIVSIFKIEASNYAQNTKITLDLNNVTIEKVLKEIEMKTEFKFLFSRDDINVNKLVSVKAKNEKVKNILNKIFLDMSVSFELLNKQIIIKNTPKDKEENPINLLIDQQLEIKGTVTDSNGTPLPGVSILIVGTVKGTETDFNGNYSIESKEGDIIEFSFIGMKTERIIVGLETIINVQLDEDLASLDEIVVVGYGKMKRSDLTGSISSVSAKELKKGVVFSTEQLLQGKVAGLSVIQSSGDPTSTASLRLRGGTSLSAGNGPLVVVDGISGVDFNTIQPSEIVSIDVLKDASATAIYGSRGANGVIIVTTNSTRKGKTMKYDGYYATGKVAKNIDLLSASQWRKYVSEKNPVGAIDYGGDTDWQKAIQQTSIVSSHTISFVNNSEDGGNRVSLNYLSNKGVIIKSDLERFGASLAGHQYAFDKKLRLEAGIHSTFDKSSQIDYRVFQRSYNINPTIPIRDADGNYTNYAGVFYENPVEISNNRTSDNAQQRIFGYGKVELEIIKGLRGVTTVSYEYNSVKNSLYIPTYALLDGQSENGRAERSLADFSNKQLESYLTYDLEFNNDHKLNLLAGYSYLEHGYEGFGAQRRGFDTDSFLYNNLGAGQDVRATDVSSYKGESKLISFYGRANYNFLNKYLFTASVRKDGSSRFGANNKWGLFPSASFAWRVSEESFMKSSAGWLENLKLRIGYGITGNQDGIGEYKSLSLISAGGAPYYDSETGTWKQSYGIIQNVNPNLKWESTAQFNIGVDFSLFKFINGSLEIYDKKTSDLLYTYEVPQPPYLFGTILANVGDLSNKGVELTLNANLAKKTDLNWNTTLTLSHNTQKIEKLSNETYQTDAIVTGSLHGLPGMSGQYAQVIKEGYAVGTFWGPKSTGIDANGQITYENDGETQYLGNAQPKYNFGLSTDLTYKKFDFQVATYGMFGQKVLNATNMVLSDPNRLPINNATNSSLTNGITSNAAYSSHWIEDASFLRLQNVTIGYNFDTKNIGVEKCRLSLTGENLFVLTGYNGIDPEVNIDGLDHPGMDVYNYYPKTRSVSLGLNFSF